jgi:hypothetical protein
MDCTGTGSSCSIGLWVIDGNVESKQRTIFVLRREQERSVMDGNVDSKQWTISISMSEQERLLYEFVGAFGNTSPSSGLV